MSQKPRGFTTVALVIVVAALIGLGIYAYSKSQEQTGGATVYTTQLSDTFNTFREQVNSSTANLNTELESVSGTVHGYGTIVSQNTPLLVSAGGTGTTTVPTNAQFLSASGTTPAWKTLTFGSGLNSTTTATSVQVSSQGVDVTQNFAWTGNNTHAGSETFSSATVINASGSVTDNASTSFTVFPTVTTTSPTSSLQLAPKGYVDLFLATAKTSSTAAASTGSCPGCTQSTASTTISFSANQGAIVLWACTVTWGTSAGSASVNMDGSSVFAPGSSIGTINFTSNYVVAPTSTATTHTFNASVSAGGGGGSSASISCAPTWYLFKTQ